MVDAGGPPLRGGPFQLIVYSAPPVPINPIVYSTPLPLVSPSSTLPHARPTAPAPHHLQRFNVLVGVAGVDAVFREAQWRGARFCRPRHDCGLSRARNTPTQGTALLRNIEHGLHPTQQKQLMTDLRRHLATHPELQIIAATHSPFILDECRPEEIHVLHQAPSGFVHAATLDNHPRYAYLHRTLSNGEIWVSEGEEWVDTALPQPYIPL